MNDTADTLDQAAVQAQIQRMGALLAQGRAVMAKVDDFYREHDLVPGIGEQTLMSEAVPERHRAIFSKLLAEFDMIERRIDEFDPHSTQPAPVAVSARAVGNRYRI